MLKWKFFQLYQLICQHRHGEESSGRTVPDQPCDKNRPTLVHGELVLDMVSFVLGLLVLQDLIANISLYISSFSQVHMLLLPFLPITALIIQVGFLLIKFPHLNVASHNQNLIPTQNVTELDNLERASAISD